MAFAETKSEGELANLVRRLADRQEILDCLYRHSRGLDRLDRELVLSAYHPDAVDNHGVFTGSRDEFVDWVMPHNLSRFSGMHHHITNHTCDLDGDVAHTETYFLFAAKNVEGTPLTLSGGRYIDRFERRAEEWKIAKRVVLVEWKGGLTDFALPNPLERHFTGIVARDKTDHSYDRSTG